MLFNVLKRDARANAYALASSGAVAALSRLRQQPFPSLPEIPFFGPRPSARSGAAWGLENVARQAFYAAVIAGLVLTTAIVVPTFISSQQESSASSAATALHSSIGVTGTADSRVEDLSVSTFVGRVPFVQQHNYIAAMSGSTSDVQRFVVGARQGQLAAYVNGVGQQVTLKYLSNAVEAKQAIAAWQKAEDDAKAAQPRQAAPVYQSSGSTAWQPPSVTGGTRLASTVTFYSCIGNGFCGGMSNGQKVFAGAAACSYNLPFGTKFRVENDPAGRVFTCTDRGALSSTWVDIWFYDISEGWAWQSMVGTRSNIIVLA